MLDQLNLVMMNEEERRVGFNGTKVEDMNRVDVMPRPRLAVGLPGDLTLELAWVPPIEVEGVTPNLLAVAVERPVFDRQRLILGLRAHGQLGGTEGDYTCSEHDASYPPGSEDNPFGCEAPSSDTATLDTLGFGLTGGYRIGGDRGATLHFGAFANHMDREFQVDALTYGLRDRTRLVTDGWTGLQDGRPNRDLIPPDLIVARLFDFRQSTLLEFTEEQKRDVDLGKLFG